MATQVNNVDAYRTVEKLIVSYKFLSLYEILFLLPIRCLMYLLGWLIHSICICGYMIVILCMHAFAQSGYGLYK